MKIVINIVVIRLVIKLNRLKRWEKWIRISFFKKCILNVYVWEKEDLIIRVIWYFFGVVDGNFLVFFKIFISW